MSLGVIVSLFIFIKGISHMTILLILGYVIIGAILQKLILMRLVPASYMAMGTMSPEMHKLLNGNVPKEWDSIVSEIFEEGDNPFTKHLKERIEEIKKTRMRRTFIIGLFWPISIIIGLFLVKIIKKD